MDSGEIAFLITIILFFVYAIYLLLAYLFNWFPFPPSATWDPMTQNWVRGNVLTAAYAKDAQNLCQTGWGPNSNAYCAATPTDASILQIYSHYNSYTQNT